MRTQAILGLTLTLLFAGCNRESSTRDTSSGSSEAGSALDAQAKAAGILPDSSNIKFAGRFETRGDLGTDKFCAVKSAGAEHIVGVLAVFGPDSKCEGKGTATINGEKVSIALQGKDSCNFNAEFDGVELRFPGAMQPGCASYCSDRASLSGTSYFMVEQGDDNARRTLGRDIPKLCG